MPQKNKAQPKPMNEPPEASQDDVLEPRGDEAWRTALEVVRDYRGDVTFELQDGSKLVGYVFDIDWNVDDGPTVRLDLPETGERSTIPSSRITRMILSGRDPAAGKSWEKWVRRYAETRLTGEDASIECDSLEPDSSDRS